MVATQAKIAILGADPIICGSLEALLRAEGYRAWFLPDDKVYEANAILAEYQLLIFAPAPNSGFRAILLGIMSSRPGGAIPVLELLSVDAEQSFPGEHVVPWPCSPERLKRAIDSALLGSRE